MAFFRIVLLFDAILWTAFPSVSAFGARMEPFASHQGGFSSSRGGAPSLTQLRVNEPRRRSTQNHPTSYETDKLVSFQELLDGFDFPPAVYQNLNDFVVAHEMIDGTFFYLREQADLLASETFAASPIVTEPSRENWAVDDDDEECLIPEEWKKLPTMMESIDVMQFLGINRVRPLTVSTNIYRNS